MQEKLFYELNQGISEDFPGHNQILKGLEIDWQLIADPKVSEKSLDFSMKGLAYPQNFTE